jgi:hypothetical protein
MKATRIVLLALILAGALAGAASALTSVSAGVHIGPSGRAAVDLGVFYDDLAPYGHWVQSASYGWVWTPRIRRAGWRPYLDGHWVWTDWGWTWVSDEPYGWACYHYGRWIDDASFGWEWVPGNDWGPAWVSWQEGGDFIGWAALPPGVDVRAGRFDVSLAPASFVFVPERRFLDPGIARFAVPIDRANSIFPRTRNFTNYRFANNRVFNAGVPVDHIQRAVGRPVPSFQVGDLGWAQRHQARIAQNRVAMFRPQVQRAGRVDPPPARPLARRSVMAAAAASAVRQQNARQNRGQQIASQRRFGQQGRMARQTAHQNHGQQIASERRFGQQGRAMRQTAQPNRGQQVRQQQVRQQGRPQHPQTVAPRRAQRPAVERRQRQGPPPQRTMTQARPQRPPQRMRAERPPQRQGPPPQRTMAQARPPRPQPQANPNRGRGGQAPGQRPNRDRNKPPGQG